MEKRREFYSQSISSEKRIGPHDKDVISVLVGSLLGDGYAQKRKNSTRFQIEMSSKNASYIFWLHNFFADRGYCSAKKPVVKKQIGKKNTVYFSIKFKTFSFSSLNYLYHQFYCENNQRKKIPTQIYELLTPKALAIWIMNDGEKSGSGLKISTKPSSFTDNLLLQKIFSEKWGITPTVQHHLFHTFSISFLSEKIGKGMEKTGKDRKRYEKDKQKYLVYFKKNDLLSLSYIVKPHMLFCMYYKLNIE